jgi:DNA-directed RNA polymerase
LFRDDKFFVSKPNELVEIIIVGLSKTGEFKLTTSDNCTIFLEYYKFENFRIDNKIRKTRQTMILNSISDNLDFRKTRQAFIANLIHSCDAEFARLIINELGFGIITIHDCFGIDILNVDLLIKAANISINNIKITEFFIDDFDFYRNAYKSYYILL